MCVGTPHSFDHFEYLSVASPTQVLVPDKQISFFKTLVRYPLAREGVSAPGRHVWLPHAMQKENYIVGLTAYG